MKKLIAKTIRKFGYTISRIDDVASGFPDMKEKEFWDIYNLCKPYTMTSVERMYALYTTVNYILQHGIPGCFVECGVWRGGCAMLIAKMLSNRNITDRPVYLFDTFEGMSEPTDADRSFKDESAADLLERSVEDKENSVWCLADLADVKRNLERTGLPANLLFYIKGKVEDTIPKQLPGQAIALLRLDTDWYESTRHELNFLFPLVVRNGVLIIDDYGHWEGCRKAVDEYFRENNFPVLLYRIDYTGRMAIKNFG